MTFFLLLRPAAWVLLLLPLSLAQYHQPPIQDRYQTKGGHAGIIVGASIGTILLLFLVSVLYARIVDCRREASRGRVERIRTDEEFAIAPLPALSSTLFVSPPPYENPPPFEDAIKQTQTTSATGSRPREEQDGRGDVVG